jgi:hypothetical protein
MDLQKYREMIGKKLLDQIDRKIAVDKKIERGNVGHIKVKNPINNKVKVQSDSEIDLSSDSADSADSDSGSDSDSDMEGGKLDFVKSVKKAGKKMVKEEGGKFSFKKMGKSLKHVGNEIGKDVKKGAKMVKDTAVKTGAQMAGKEAGEYLYNGIKQAGKDFMQYAPEVAEDAGMTVAENPELLLAAGVEKEKKPKRTRNVSDRERKRHAMVRKVMQKYGVSLPEASKMIKTKNIKY